MQMSNLGRTVRLLVLSALWGTIGTSNTYAQEFQTLSKVTSDTIWLKWLPSDYSALLKMGEGASVSRIEVKSAQNLESLDFTNSKKWEIAPVQERFDRLNPQDSVQDRMATLLDPIVDPLPEEAQNFAFGSVIIENVTQPLFQYELGNLIVDTDFEKRKKYAYRIEIKNADPIYAFVDASEKTTFTEPTITLKLDRKKTVVCTWDMASIREEAFAFDIEHAVSNIKNAERLLEEPYLPFKSEFEKNQDDAEIRHDDPERGKMHYYRIIGRDAFGAPSLTSQWEEIYVPNRIEAYAVIDSVSVEGTSRIIHASITEDRFYRNFGIRLERSTMLDQGYESIQDVTIDEGESQFSIATTVAETSGDAFYYRIVLSNEDDTLVSQPYYKFTLDQEAPLAPEGLRIDIDSNGIARLNWLQLEDPGLLGYRVFRGNQKKEEFAERTTELSLETSWVDTLSLDNLTSEVYYYIQGVDANYNQGAHSDTVMGLKPDTIAPVAGLIRKISMVENGVALELIPSSSKDAVSNILYRGNRALGDVGEAYVDTNLVPGKFYSYRVETSDRTGNTSVSKEVSQMYEPGFRAAPEGSIRADFQGNFIEISYKLPALEIYSVQIYRSKKGEPSRRWKTIHDQEQSSIQDRSIRIGETYQYQVKYITSEGIHSLPLELEATF